MVEIEANNEHGFEVLVARQKSKWEKYTTQSKTNQNNIMDFFNKFDLEDFDVDMPIGKELI